MKALEQFVEVELTDEELKELTGGSMSSAECNYLWTMCLVAPWGCTSPCTLWASQCN